MSSDPKVFLQNNQIFMATNEYDALIKNINNYAADTITKNAQTCASQQLLNQEINFSDIESDGDIVFGDIDQIMKTEVSFSCVNTNEVSADLSQNIATMIQQAITNETSPEILSKIEAKANALAPTVSQESNTSQNISNKTNIENITEKNTKLSFNNENVSNCINNINQNQALTATKIRSGGNIVFKGIKQDMAAKSLSDCISKNNYSAKAVQKVLDDLNIKVGNKVAPKITTENKFEQLPPPPPPPPKVYIPTAATFNIAPISKPIAKTSTTTDNSIFYIIGGIVCCLLLVIIAVVIIKKRKSDSA